MYVLTTTFAHGKLNVTRLKSKESVVFPESDVASGMIFGSALANDDVTGDNGFTTKLLYAKALTF